MTSRPPIPLVKAHAYGNDFLLVEATALPAGADRADLARQACNRHRGVGGDGLLVLEETPAGARMQLWNSDGSPSELSGNGVRTVAAWLADRRELDGGAVVVVETDAGPKRVTVIERTGVRVVCQTDLGKPMGLRLETIPVDGTPVTAVVLRVGNPQCVVLGELSEARLHGLAARLSVHPYFPEGTNVELADVERPDRVRILIWERGVGPTESSGTGTAAAAVAASAFGGAARTVDVISPGGTQRVEWSEEGIRLTGWAELTARVLWLSADSAMPAAR
ncbi:MAG TPA: diaminopimelate epimerase [Vicinamibacterales bacterium]|nr:diaminopimelate epimerase [Vicinamibacterales bacterium]